MDVQKAQLQGSVKRDIFKRMHKQLHRSFYGCDVDFCLVSKRPPGTVAYLDYKSQDEHVTFSEVLQYNAWLPTPVFIVIGSNPESGAFLIERYLGGDWRPFPPECEREMVTTTKSWKEFGEWERRLRRRYTQSDGWKLKNFLP